MITKPTRHKKTITTKTPKGSSTIHIRNSAKGSLHRALGVPQGQKIPAAKLSIKPDDSEAIRKKKQFAINEKKFKH